MKAFKLRKWRTNDRELRAQIQKDATDLENTTSEAEEQTYAKEMIACQTGSQFNWQGFRIGMGLRARFN